MSVQLGHRYKDPVSGWEGIAVAVHSYLYGCRRITIASINKDGAPEEWSFDEPQLVEVEGETLDTPTDLALTGGPRGTRKGSG